MPHINPGATLARNLLALMEYARDRKSGPSNGVELQAASGVSDSTISRWLKQGVSPRLDDLHKVAKAYELQTWQLLYPKLDPANPPAVPDTSSVQQELIEILKAGAELIAKQGLVAHASEGEIRAIRSGRADREVSSKVAAKKAAKRHNKT